MPTNDNDDSADVNLGSIWDESFTGEFSELELKELAEKLNSKRSKRSFTHVLSPPTDTSKGSETGPSVKKNARSAPTEEKKGPVTDLSEVKI